MAEPDEDQSDDDCPDMVQWWDGEYEGECIRPKGHTRDHYDGLSWWNAEHEDTTYENTQTFDRVPDWRARG